MELGYIEAVDIDEVPEGRASDVVEILKTSGFVGLVFVVIQLLGISKYFQILCV